MKKRKFLSLVIVLATVIVAAILGGIYYEYIPRVLVDDTQTLKENHIWQFDLFVLGNRNVNITVSTAQYLVAKLGGNHLPYQQAGDKHDPSQLPS